MPSDETDSTSTAHAAPPCTIVIFGAAGDLTKRKLIPALYNLRESKLLPDNFAVIGLARAEMNDEEFRRRLSDDMREFATDTVDPKIWDWLEERLFYLSGDFNDEQTYQSLKELLNRTDTDQKTQGNFLFYLATAPEYFAPVVRRLGAAGLTSEEENAGWRHVVIEKPFGSDLESAKKLNSDIKEVLDERQVYRIDHYLGKETVQNIMVFRFGNGIFEPIWNRRYIDCVQITAAEKVGVEKRGGYYDKAGALRDMVPNHLLQLVTLTAMEPPISFDADAVRDEQTKILHAIQHPPPEEVARRAVRAQYDAGEIDAEKVSGYRDEPNVAPDSQTETFVALKLLIDNWRWADVPFYLRTGKRLADRDTEIAITFKHAPYSLFRKTAIDRLTTNRLVLHIQPDEGISLRFGAKIPGPVLSIGAVDMDFDYEDYFGNTPSTGYERLLYDCMMGDATLFQRADQVEAAWGVVAPIQEIWARATPGALPTYKAGSWGPIEADELLKCDERSWQKTHNVADKSKATEKNQDGAG